MRRNVMAALSAALMLSVIGGRAFGQVHAGPATIRRLPPVEPAAEQAAEPVLRAMPAGYEAMEVGSTLENRIADLEKQLADLKAAGEKDKPADKKKDEDADEGYVVGSDLTMKANWKDGFEVQSANKDFRIHVGGRTQFDVSAFSPDSSVEGGPGGVGALRDAANFRRARLRVDGTLYEVFEFASEYDFSNTINIDPFTQNANIPPSSLPPQSNPATIGAITELWVSVTHLPVVGTIRAGNVKDPFGFEHNTSSRFLNFMERSFSQDLWEGAFNNGFIPGIMMFNTAFDERMTWSVGEFKANNNVFGWGVGDGELETCGRLTFLPFYQDDGRYLMHVGIAGKHIDCDEQITRFRARGDVRSGPPGPLNPVFIDTRNLSAQTEDHLGLEWAGVAGPWSWAGEYFGTWVNDAVSLGNVVPGASFQPPAGTPLGTPYFQAAYVEVLYFLTGEYRGYNKKTGAFDRVVPLENFFFVKTPGGNCGGWGAWQVGARIQFADLRDNGVDGGQLTAVTLGLNWFLNPNMKIQWNYDWTHRDFLANGSDGDIHSFGTRLAWDF